MKRQRSPEDFDAEMDQPKQQRMKVDKARCGLEISTSSDQLVIKHINNENVKTFGPLKSNGISLFMLKYPSEIVYRVSLFDYKLLYEVLRKVLLCDEFGVRKNLQTYSTNVVTKEEVKQNPLAPHERLTFTGSLKDVNYFILSSCGENWFKPNDTSLRDSFLLIENKLGQCDLRPSKPKEQFLLLFLGEEPSIRVRRRGLRPVIDIQSTNSFSYLDDAIRYQASCDELHFIQFRSRLQELEWKSAYRETVRDQAEEELKRIDRKKRFKINLRHFKGKTVQLIAHYDMKIGKIRQSIRKKFKVTNEEVVTLFFCGLLLIRDHKALVDYYANGMGEDSTIWAYIDRVPSQPPSPLPVGTKRGNFGGAETRVRPPPPPSVVVAPPTTSRPPSVKGLPLRAHPYTLPGLPSWKPPFDDHQRQRRDDEDEQDDADGEKDLVGQLRKKKRLKDVDFMEDEEFFGEIHSNNLDIFEQSLKNERESLKLFMTREEQMGHILDRFGYKYSSTRIPSDGNCMFSSLSDQLFPKKGIVYASQIRKYVVDYLRSNEATTVENGETIRSFLNETRYQSWENFLKMISKDDEWGNFLCLRAVATVFKVTILVVSDIRDGSLALIKPINSNSTRVISLCHFHEFHYRSIIEK